jgi:ACT domain-containing protein
MANEELIYRITRAVYESLGAGADERVVEKLVTGVYRAVEPAVKAESVARGAAATTNQFAIDVREGGTDAEGRMVVSVFGVDRPGIVAAVSQILAETQCSIVDINQTVVQGKFAMVLIADASHARQSIASLKERFREEGARLGVRIYAQREDLFNAMHRV